MSATFPAPRSYDFPTTPVRRAPVRSRAVADETAAPVPSTVYWRRRAGAVLAVFALALMLALMAGFGGAEAGLSRPATAGTAVVAPGQTLWDVAATTAPAGVDARTYLAQIRELNGLSSASVAAWTVVLLPTS